MGLAAQTARNSNPGNAGQIGYKPSAPGSVWTTVQAALDGTAVIPVSYATKTLATAGQAGKSAGLVIVTADESKDGGATLYFWTGSAFRWVASVEDAG